METISYWYHKMLRSFIVIDGRDIMTTYNFSLKISAIFQLHAVGPMRHPCPSDSTPFGDASTSLKRCHSEVPMAVTNRTKITWEHPGPGSADMRIWWFQAKPNMYKEGMDMRTWMYIYTCYINITLGVYTMCLSISFNYFLSENMSRMDPLKAVEGPELHRNMHLDIDRHGMIFFPHLSGEGC